MLINLSNHIPNPSKIEASVQSTPNLSKTINNNFALTTLNNHHKNLKPPKNITKPADKNTQHPISYPVNLFKAP
jgi:hypothetical protein